MSQQRHPSMQAPPKPLYGPFLPEKPQPLVYIVEGKERLADIARKYFVSVNDLVRANLHLCNPHDLQGGEALIIPFERMNLSEFNLYTLRHTFNDMEPRQRFGRLKQKNQVDPRLLMRCQPRSNANGVSEVTAEELSRILPALGEKASTIVGYLNQAMQDGQVSTRLGQAMFIAQVAVESVYFTTLEELGAGATKGCPDGKTQPYFVYMYDKTSCNKSRQRKAAELGNTDEGDGTRYHGRGYIQLTGRTNYRNAGAYLGLALETNPDIAAQPANAARIAGWFWRYGNGDLNQFCNTDTDANFRAVTRRINGSEDGPYTHRDRRLAVFADAKKVLGVK